MIVPRTTSIDSNSISAASVRANCSTAFSLAAPPFGEIKICVNWSGWLDSIRLRTRGE